MRPPRPIFASSILALTIRFKIKTDSKDQCALPVWIDLACDTGQLERRLVEAMPEAPIVGVDIAPAMIDRARSKLEGTPNVRFKRADVHDLPFEETE